LHNLSLSCFAGTHRYRNSFPTRRSSDLLAAAGGAEQDEAVARVDGEADFVGGTHDALAGAVFQADPLDFQQRRRRQGRRLGLAQDRKSTRLNSSHVKISYAVFCLKKKKT